MRRIPLRWTLPIFHLTIDLVLVVFLIFKLSWLSNHPPESGFFRPVSYHQNVTVLIEPRAPGLVKPFSLLITAALPAGAISLFVLSFAGHDVYLPYDSRAFLWLALYEVLAVSIWVSISSPPTAYW